MDIKTQTGKVYRRPLSHLKIVPPPSAVRDANTFRDTLDRKKFMETVLNTGGLGSVSVPHVDHECVERDVSVPVVATPEAVERAVSVSGIANGYASSGEW